VGLVRADGTPKPSYDALHRLLKGEWWQAPTTVVTDAEGRLRVKGFRGEYEVSSADGAATFPLDGGAVAPVRLALRGAGGRVLP
jgi:endo-1,4-beta-xylanase